MHDSSDKDILYVSKHTKKNYNTKLSAPKKDQKKATEATLTQTDVPLLFLENLENLGQYTIQSTQSHSKGQCQLCDHADLDTGFLM